jgi:hypothetical protein
MFVKIHTIFFLLKDKSRFLFKSTTHTDTYKIHIWYYKCKHSLNDEQILEMEPVPITRRSDSAQYECQTDQSCASGSIRYW